MTRMWTWWVARAGRPVDVRPLALTRICLSLVVIADLLLLAQSGMLGRVYRLFEYGGLAGFHRSQFWFLDAGPNAGLVLYGVLLVSMICVALGVRVRIATLIGVLAYAQLGHMFPTGDRGVDRLVRTVLLVLLFSDAHRCYSLENVLFKRERKTTTAGWVSDVLRLFLGLVYMAAGFVKLGAGGWFSMAGPPQLYKIMTDPMAAKLDPDNPVWRSLWPLFRGAGMITVSWEVCSPLLLTRWSHFYGIIGVLMHIGIALSMKLGMFSYGMLSLYPVVMAPWLIPVINRLEARLGWETVARSD